MFLRTWLMSLAAMLVLSAYAANDPSELKECQEADTDHICSTLFRQLNKLSKKGSPEAATLLAVFYMTGEQGLPQDYAKAMQLYKRAARKNSPVAQYELAKHLLLGEHLQADKEQAMGLLQKAAKRGYAEAHMLYNILLLEDPATRVEDKPELIAEIEALELISPEHAYNFLGRFYLMEGKKAQAFRYLKEASRRGVKQAQTLLAENFAAEEDSFPDAERDGFERIEVTAAQVDVNDAAREVIRYAKSSSMFNGKSTGSRIPGQSCVFDGTCSVLHSKRDIQLMNNMLSGIRR